MKKISLLLVFSFLLLAACAQTNCSVKKARAFYTVTLPGMAIQDENGNTINPVPVIDRFIYIEWGGSKKPEVVNVQYGATVYSAGVTAVEGNIVVPGGDYGDNKKHTISANKRNKLWKLIIDPPGESKNEKQDCKNIVIRLRGKGNVCEIKLLKETILATLPRY